MPQSSLLDARNGHPPHGHDPTSPLPARFGPHRRPLRMPSYSNHPSQRPPPPGPSHPPRSPRSYPNDVADRDRDRERHSRHLQEYPGPPLTRCSTLGLTLLPITVAVLALALPATTVHPNRLRGISISWSPAGLTLLGPRVNLLLLVPLLLNLSPILNLSLIPIHLAVTIPGMMIETPGN